MGLRLQEADTCVELCRDIHILIFHGKDANERCIVGSDMCDVGIFSIAELLSAVASDLRLLFEMSCCSGKLVDYSQNSVNEYIGNQKCHC